MRNGRRLHEELGARPNAGLSKEKEKLTVSWVGPNGATKQVSVLWRVCTKCTNRHPVSLQLLARLQAVAISGQRFRDIARGSGIPIKYDCQEGTCKTCEAMVNGRRTKLCVARMVHQLSPFDSSTYCR